MRLRVGDVRWPMPPMAPEDTVVVEFVLGDAGTICRLRGRVFRRTDDFCVIDIDQVYKFGEFEKIQPMDVMEITTTLLNMRPGPAMGGDGTD